MGEKKGKRRSCPICGKDMGFIESRYYDRDDTCGSPDCEREMRDALYEDLERELDRQLGW